MKQSLLLLAMVAAAQFVSAQNVPPPLKLPLPDTTSLHPAPPLLPTVLNYDSLVCVCVGARTGGWEPYRLIHELASRGDTAVPLLSKLLSDTTLRLDRPVDTTRVLGGLATGDSSSTQRVNLSPPRMIAVLALESIGGEEALLAIRERAERDPDPEVRGACLNILCHSTYDRVVNKELKPDPGVVRTLLGALDDGRWVNSLERHVSEIAWLGWERWMGEEFGDVPPADRIVRVGSSKQPMTLTSYWDQWWSTNGPKLVWDDENSRFVVK